MKLVVTITHGSNHDLSSVGWTIANVAKNAGHEVAVFLTSDGVYCAKAGYPDMTSVRPFKPLEELVRSFLEAKGTVWACSPCVQHRGILPAEFLPGTVVTGAGALVEWMASGSQSLTF